ncbi:MAG: sugar ABC transporter permease [Anaerolineae bacterium]|nr:sugar ABC transporter permease [Anaerolineae bacterium]
MTAGLLRTVAGRRGVRSREHVEAYVFLLPWILGFLAWTLGPMLTSAGLAFTDYQILLAPKWVALENFRHMLEDELFVKALGNTAFYTFIGVPLQITVALVAAMALNRQVRGVSIYRTAFYLPSLTPAVANAMMWLWLLNPEFGLANALLRAVGLPPQRWFMDVKLAKPSMIIMSLWGIGGQMIIFLAGLQGIPDLYYEAARVDGARNWHMLRHITVPLLSPSIFFNAVVSIIGSFQVFTTAFVATGGGPQNATLFYVLYLYRNGFQYFKMGYASALAWVLFVIILGFTLLQFRVGRYWVYYEVE